MEANCEKCGVDLPRGSLKFCPECGYKFAKVIVILPPQKKEQTAQRFKPLSVFDIDPNDSVMPATHVKEQNGSRKSLTLIGGIFLAGIFAAYYFGGGFEGSIKKDAMKSMQEIQIQVANDAVQQYEIAKRSGNKIDIAVQASLVCAAYLQAKDEVNYKKWKAIEKQADKDAGLPTGR